MRSPLTLLAAMLVSCACAACGGAGTTRPDSRSSPTVHAASGIATSAVSNARLPQIAVTADAESDSDTYPGEPDNEDEVFGHVAGRRDALAVATLVRRYYAAAAAADGAGACRLLYSPLAESVAEDYGGPSNSPGLRGNTCAAVMSKLFMRSHGRLSAEGATLKVAAVRVDRNRGGVQLGFNGKRPARYILVHRERGAWKVDMLLDVGRPVGVE